MLKYFFFFLKHIYNYFDKLRSMFLDISLTCSV